MEESQQKKQAAYRAEVEEAVIAEMEYLRVEGEQVRAGMEAKEDERRQQLAEEERRKEQLRMKEERREQLGD